MYINGTYSDQPNSQCNCCSHYSSCEYRVSVIRINTKISNLMYSERANINVDNDYFKDELPIEISVNCKRFAKK